jgi:hypothetical protein
MTAKCESDRMLQFGIDRMPFFNYLQLKSAQDLTQISHFLD